MFFYFLLCFLFFNPIVHSHSSMECVKKAKDGIHCIGFPRYYHFNAINIALPSSSNNETFFQSRDRFWHPGTHFGVCPPGNGLEPYTQNYPMAKAKPGEKLVTQHPPRGHASQPNSDVKIFMMNSPGFVEQPNLQNMKLVGSFPFTKSCVGLEREISWANCTGTFRIPNKTRPGIYTFFWSWDLGAIPYGDCFEVEVN